MKPKRQLQHSRVAETQRAEVNGSTSDDMRLPDATRERLGELSTLEPDWDSYGALPVSHRALAAAEGIVRRVIGRTSVASVPHEIMPIADGGVSLEWRYPRAELGLNACPEGGWTSLVVERGEGGRRASEGYDLSDDDAVALAVRVIQAASF